MGVVYRGRQEPLGRPVALKVLADQVAGDPAVVQRFEKEAQAVSRLNHPNIVTVYEFGRTDDGLLFLAMELLEGESLFARLKRGPLEPAVSVDVMTQVARALAEAHAQGIVHRDLKPENIMLLEGRDGELIVKVLDFGLAKMVGPEQGAAPLTSASVIMGTPGYMSPEQIHAKPLDARTDLYALGMVWWEMLVGRRPFDGDTPIELLVKHLQRPLPAPTTARPQLVLPAKMERLVLRLGEKDPNARPDDGAALLGELRTLREDAWTVDAGAGALSGASDDEWDKAFAAVSEPAVVTTSDVPPASEATKTEALDAWEVPSAETHARRQPEGGAPPLAPPPGAAMGTQRFPVPGATLSKVSSGSPAAPSIALPAPSIAPPAPPSAPLPLSDPAGAIDDAPMTLTDAIDDEPRAPAPSPAPALAPASAPAPAPAPPRADPPASPPRPPLPLAAAPPSAFPLPGAPPRPSPPAELKPEFDFPPRPPPPSAFRPPPNPFAGAEQLELERPRPGRAPTHFPSEPAAPPPDVKWQVRSGGVVQGPLPFSELLALVRAGNVRKSDDAAPLGEPFRPLESYPLLMRELAARKGDPLTGRASGANASPLYRRVAFLGLFVLAALCGALYGLAPDAIEARLSSLFGGLPFLTEPAPVAENPLQKHFKKWRSELGVPTASAAEALALARVALKQETVSGRKEADAALRLGLLVEPDNLHLLAALAENRAWLRAMGHKLDDVAVEPVVAYARTRAGAGEDVDVLRASAAVALLADPGRGPDRGEAEKTLLGAARLDGGDPGVKLLLALARLARPAEALAAAEKALTALPGSTRARLVVGMAARRLGRYDEATEHLEARARAEPTDALAGRELALALLEQGLTRRATRALEVAYAATGDPATARLFALALLDDPAGERRADSILAEATKRAERDRDGAPLLALRARLLVKLGSAQQAVVLAEDATRRFPRDGEVKAALARAYEGAGRVVEARRAYAEAESLAAGPREVAKLAQAKGDLELRAGQRTAAAEAYEHSVALASERAGPRVALALLALERGDEDAARLALMGLLDVDPRQDRDRDRRLEPFASEPYAFYRARAAALLARDTGLVAQVMRGVTSFHDGDLRAARRALYAALRKDRSQSVALLYIAALDLEEGELASAQRRLQLLEVTKPESPVVSLYLARVEAADKPERAEARLARLTSGGRFPVEVATVRGAIEAARGERESAVRRYEDALARDPSYLPARHALASGPAPLE